MNSSTESRQKPAVGAGKIDQVAVVGQGVGDAAGAERAAEPLDALGGDARRLARLCRRRTWGWP